MQAPRRIVWRRRGASWGCGSQLASRHVDAHAAQLLELTVALLRVRVLGLRCFEQPNTLDQRQVENISPASTLFLTLYKATPRMD